MKKSYKLIVSIILTLMSFCSFANTENLQHENKEVVKSVYQYLTIIQTKPLLKSDLNKYFTPNVEMITNDVITAHGIDGFYNHFNMIIKTHTYTFIIPQDAIIAELDHVVIKYKIIMNFKGKEKVVHVIAIFTLKNHKINRWDEVVYVENSKDTCLVHY